MLPAAWRTYGSPLLTRRHMLSLEVSAVSLYDTYSLPEHAGYYAFVRDIPHKAARQCSVSMYRYNVLHHFDGRPVYARCMSSSDNWRIG